MPGQGGFLSRFYSLIVATPFLWFYTALFLLILYNKKTAGYTGGYKDF
jgi:hypothetical protein